MHLLYNEDLGIRESRSVLRACLVCIDSIQLDLRLQASMLSLSELELLPGLLTFPYTVARQSPCKPCGELDGRPDPAACISQSLLLQISPLFWLSVGTQMLVKESR